MCVLAVLPESDINRDGIVNLEDHAIMANEWLETGSQSSAEFRPICKAGKYTGDGYVFHPIELGIYPVHVVIRSSEQAEGRTGVEMINIAPSAGVDNIKWNQSSSTIRDDCGFYATGFFVEGDAAPVNKAGVEYFYVVYGYK
jgi:hypothetical protein